MQLLEKRSPMAASETRKSSIRPKSLLTSTSRPTARPALSGTAAEKGKTNSLLVKLLSLTSVHGP